MCISFDVVFEGCIQLIKSDIKDKVTNYAVLLNFLFIKFPTLIIIINVCWSSDPHIRVICEGSCDTEDWSNDAENHRNKLHFTVYSQKSLLPKTPYKL